jgi:hypothetical protein
MSNQPLSRPYHTKCRDRSDTQVLADQRRLRPDGTKWCTVCKTKHPLSEFPKKKLSADGLMSLCKKARSNQRHERGRINSNRTDAEILKTQKALGGQKRCHGICKRILPVGEFQKSRQQYDGLHTRCVHCQRTVWLEVKNLRDKFKETGCAQCGWKGHHAAIFIVHREGEAKLKDVHGYTVSPALIRSLSALKPELNKSRPLCANCHAADRDNSWNGCEPKKKHIKERYEFVNAEKMKRGHCVDCDLVPGVQGPFTAFEFDHRNPEEKVAAISEMLKIKKNSLEKLIHEMKKCDLRCRRCHTIRSFNQMQQRFAKMRRKREDLVTAQKRKLEENAFEDLDDSDIESLEDISEKQSIKRRRINQTDAVDTISRDRFSQLLMALRKEC